MSEASAAIPIPLDVDAGAGGRIYSPCRDRPSSRSASRPKSLGRGTGASESLFPVLNAPSAKSRHTGRRKKHRWENSRILSSLFPGEVEPGEFDEDIAIKDVFRQDWTSLFKGLTAQEFESFRECEGEEYERAVLGWKKKKIGKVKKFIANLPPEKRFEQLDSKLRHHLLKVGLRMNGFLYDLEVFLLETLELANVSEEPKSIPLESLPKRLQNSLTIPPVIMLQPNPVDEKDLSPAVTLTFKSSFYRLLAHAVSQFHCLHTVTKRLNSGKKEMTFINVLHARGYEVIHGDKRSANTAPAAATSWELLDASGVLESSVVDSSKGFGYSSGGLVSITSILEAQQAAKAQATSQREKMFYGESGATF